MKHITATQILLANTSHLIMPKLKNKSGGMCSEDLEIFRECLGTFTQIGVLSLHISNEEIQ